MNVIQARDAFRIQLSSLYSKGEIDDIFKRLILHFFEWNSIKIALEPNYILTSSEAEKIKTALKALQTAVPLQYVLEKAQFYGLDFYVNKNVLIPRHETEELVSWVLEEKEKGLQLMDLGTGSGCIALALKKQRPSWHIKGIDISSKALEVAQKNADNHKIKMSFLKHDVLSFSLKEFEKQDIIVSNPPYVLPSEKDKMHRNVLENEPNRALFVPEQNPLLFYEAILEIGKRILKHKGRIYFEINPLCCEELMELCKNKGYEEVTVRRDIFQKERMLKMTLNT